MSKTLLMSSSNNLTKFENRGVQDVNLENRMDQEPNYDYYNPKDIYKKKIFSRLNGFDISFNPFIDASAHLFRYINDIMQKLKENSELDAHEIKQECIAKISLFDEKAIKIGIDNNEMLAVRYILCTVIDEFMNSSQLAKDNAWINNSLLKTFHKETYGGENFFYILDNFLKSPAKYIHILELMYICLSLGFKGRYRLSNSAEMELNNIQDSLFKQIKIVKGREPDTFYTTHNISNSKFKLFNNIPYPIIILSACVLLFILYITLTIFLNENNDSFLNLIYNEIVQSTIQTGEFNEKNV